MRQRKVWAIVALVLLSLLLGSGVQAAAVGRFISVDGQVDILKQGKLPAMTAAVNTPVEPGDVIRTKSQARAQVKFVDDSLVTLAPESRIAVADFVYDADKGQRRAVLRFFRGVIHTVVTRILNTQEPDFLMETHTAILGVRGTENYSVLLPNTTGAYLMDGLLEARSNNPQILATLLLKKRQFSLIKLGQPPGPAGNITPAMEEVLRGLMLTGIKEGAFLGAGGQAGTGSQVPGVIGAPGVERILQPFISPQVITPGVTPSAPAAPPAAPPASPQGGGTAPGPNYTPGPHP